MSATITLQHREDTLVVRDDDTGRAIVEAVVAHQRGEGDRQFRVRRSANLAVRFQASDVDAINANGVDLIDAANPTGTVQAVAA